MAKIKTSVSEKSKAKAKRYATRYGHHYSIVMIPTVTEVINGIAVTRPGKTIEFKNGIYETVDTQEQEFLDNSPFAGIDYQEVTKEVTSYSVVMGVPAIRSGWVCKCGNGIRSFDKDGVAECKTCGNKYELHGERLAFLKKDR